jgi:cytochrome c oxidase subunit 2
MAVAIVLAALVAGSVLFSLLSPWWFTPLASNWKTIDDTLHITFVITGIAFALLVLFMAYAVYRHRHREGVRAAYEPENRRLERWLTGLTTVGIAAMLAPGLLAWNDYVEVPPGAAQVEALGRQWDWAFRLPGEDGVLGTADVGRVDADNPFGLDPDDPRGRDDVLVESNELVLERGRPVKMLLRSLDVLHDFYVPQFRAKMDLVPGMVSYFWFTPERAGRFEILCAELCGVGHSLMRGAVVVEDEEAYRLWLREQPTFERLTLGGASGPAGGLAQAGR